MVIEIVETLFEEEGFSGGSASVVAELDDSTCFLYQLFRSKLARIAEQKEKGMR